VKRLYRYRPAYVENATNICVFVKSIL